MKTAILALGLFVCGAASAQATPIYFNPSNGHYYMLSSGGQNWLQAEAEAVSLGGHLVSITSQLEQDFVVNTFLSGANSRTVYWIGATDQASEGTFVWTNGDPFSYSFWNPGEPNNWSGIPTGEHWVAINWHYGLGQTSTVGTWNDTSLTGAEFGPQPFGVVQGIIEFNTNPVVPEPASLILVGTGGLLIVRRLRQRRT